MDTFNPNVDWLNSIIKTGADAYATVAGADALSHPQYATNGTPYMNGQFGTGAAGGISPTVLLIGAALLAFLFIKS